MRTLRNASQPVPAFPVLLAVLSLIFIFPESLLGMQRESEPDPFEMNKMGIVQIAQAQGGALCDLGRDNWIICPQGTVCDPGRQMCSKPVKPTAGYQVCPDGLTTCRNDLVCNLDPDAYYQPCIAPGSRRCDLHNGPTWCRPGLVCDKKRAMCSEPVKPAAGYQVCPDGLTTCRNDLVCNLDPEGRFVEPCIYPNSTRCDLHNGPTWCRPGLVCDKKYAKCSEPVKPAAGYQVCPDGLTTCRNDLVCNLDPDAYYQPCIAPGSTRCDLHNGPIWCRPGLVCDKKYAKCSEPAKPAAGYQVCPDGLTTCRNDMVCNLDPDAYYQPCIAPGSTRCDLHNGPTWCRPGLVCDKKRAMCSEPVKPAAGYQVCPDGLTTCRNDMVCNLDPEGRYVEPCITPGSTRCDLSGGPTWCRPGMFCDKQRNMCSEQKIMIRLEGPRKAKAGDSVSYSVRAENTPQGMKQGTNGYYWYVNGKAQGSTSSALSFIIPKNYQYGEIQIVARLVRARGGAEVDYLAQADTTLQVTNSQQPAGTPTTDISYDASAGNNILAVNNSIRGFGDSDKVDVWVPFSFSLSPAPGLVRAKIIMVVKPIEQLISTDSLILMGASGKGKAVFSNFESLTPKQWNTREFEITDKDVLDAIRRGGRLEGVIQDDSAVKSARLIVTVRQ